MNRTTEESPPTATQGTIPEVSRTATAGILLTAPTSASAQDDDDDDDDSSNKIVTLRKM